MRFPQLGGKLSLLRNIPPTRMGDPARSIESSFTVEKQNTKQQMCEITKKVYFGITIHTTVSPTSTMFVCVRK